MKRVAPTEDKPIITIPEVRGVAIVPVEPPAIIVVVDIEQVRVASRVGNV